ncbi:hypothetical protein [Variovorax sp. J22R115]|uniref:hypothetical protein n=1 Tax=Variovorax sp. J22R115 TaxID=3053509 RepID=UPI002576B1E7|nr:hypothetical protein [Variovorax sp. J22R115]MDM0052012.1 hypothetical protein [Variovorax sp. J22R115]
MEPQAVVDDAPTGKDWCGLSWSQWVAFDGGDFASLTTGPGVYRIRVVGQSSLVYVGQTGRSVRDRLRALRSNSLAEEMPYNDPHTAAPSLWAWRHAEGYSYECSGASATPDPFQRKALECFLLWKYRLSTGTSTLCNHGHFHPSYKKSGNRSSGVRGGLLRPEVTPRSRNESQQLLLRSAEPTASDWMGVNWSRWLPVGTHLNEAGPALYRLRHANGSELLYIGETLRLSQRAKSHARTYLDHGQIEISYATQAGGIGKPALLELENDLIGCYYDAMGRPPTFQFANGIPQALHAPA